LLVLVPTQRKDFRLPTLEQKCRAFRIVGYPTQVVRNSRPNSGASAPMGVHFREESLVKLSKDFKVQLRRDSLFAPKMVVEAAGAGPRSLE